MTQQAACVEVGELLGMGVETLRGEAPLRARNRCDRASAFGKTNPLTRASGLLDRFHHSEDLHARPRVDAPVVRAAREDLSDVDDSHAASRTGHVVLSHICGKLLFPRFEIAIIAWRGQLPARAAMLRGRRGLQQRP